MDKYHIYEEIGKGEFSQVFKGREKKKIEYVAIKRIEKSVMAKVVNEVQVMHKLNSVHMLKFHDWYETRNNLWLILEYCTGADLEALIKQDGHLPETSVRIFGLDIVAAIKFVHSKDFIHCDIRPSNFLVDEYGILKLSDFKQVRKIPKEPLRDTPLALRGSLAYMAPELLTAEGVHSFQSDLWAIGCVLYQLRRGNLPFGEPTLPVPELMENIRTVEPVNAPIPVPAPEGASNALITTHPPVTADLADLLLWLLEKSPANRCNWDNVCSHPFWAPNNPIPPNPLPAQPAFDNYIRELERSQSQQLESSSIAEFGVRLDGSTDNFLPAASHSHTAGSTPLRLPQAADSTPVRPGPNSGGANVPNSTNGQRDDLLRTGTVGIASAGAGRNGGAGGAGNTGNTGTSEALRTPPGKEVPGGISSTAMANQITPERGTSGAQQAAYALSNAQQKNQSNTRTPGSNTVTTAAALEQHNPSHGAQHGAQHGASPRTPPPNSAVANRQQQSNLSNIDLPGGDASFLQAAPLPPRQQQQQPQGKAGGQQDPLLAFTAQCLLQHSSDTQVKPIVGNKAIEIVEKILCKEGLLPFQTISTEDIGRLSQAELETHLTVVYKCLQKTMVAAQAPAPTIASSNALFDRNQALSYLYGIAPSAEVSNVVLNTHFLTLILKLMKNNIVYGGPATARPTATNGTHANLVATMNATAHQGRILAATVLAMMLRYATILQPPSIRAREDHIVASIVMLLKDSAKMDVRLKRRAVAALGETVFYISAQEEEVESSVDRWTLPPQAVEALVDCLREENDETVKHYAVKTIENVLAQGGIEYRRRFVSIELAVRLLELSQSSKNEALQSSSGMAASHLLYLVLSAHQYPPSQSAGQGAGTGTGAGGAALNTTGRVAVTARGASTNLNSTLSTTITLNDVFSIPNAVKGVKFLAKVMEKGGLPGMIEVLRDGPAKLQQAYLNIINMVFCSPLSGATESAIGIGANPTTTPTATRRNNAQDISPVNMQSINVALRMSRNFFLKSPALVPILMNLTEQAGLSAVRGKALLTAQLLSAASPIILAALTEKRLPSLLLRVLAPIFDTQEVDPLKMLAQQEVSYFARTALSMLNFLRQSCLDAVHSIRDQLSALIANPAGVLNADPGAQGFDSPTKGAVNLFNSARKASPSSPGKYSTPGADGGGSGGDGNGSAVASVAVLLSSSTVLGAVASSTSQPALRRIILASDAQVVRAVASALQLLPSARQALDSLVAAQRQQRRATVETATVLNGVEEALTAAEHACLATFEMLAQVEFIEGASGAYQFLESTVQHLIPSAARLLSHKNGDTRVVVTSALRRLLPGALHACVQLSATSGGQADAVLHLGLSSVSEVVSQCPHLLRDQAPIPQYVVRLLIEIMRITPLFAHTVVQSLQQSGTLEVLVRTLREAAQSAGSPEEDTDIADPQLAVLLRNVFETSEGPPVLLQCDLATALVTALIASVYGTMNDPLSAHSSDATVSAHEATILLVDLLHVVLHFVIRSLSTADEKDAQLNRQGTAKAPGPHLTQAETFHKQVAPLRAVSPALLLIFSYVSNFLRTHDSSTSSPHSNDASQESASAALAAYTHLIESSSRCLGILFDLFPDAVTSQLLSKLSILLDGKSESAADSASPRKQLQQQAMYPRAVLANVVSNSQIELKIRIRVLKIVSGVCKMSGNMKISHVAKEMLMTAPFNAALHACSRASDVAANMRTLGGANNMAVDDINALVRIAAQIYDLCTRL